MKVLKRVLIGLGLALVLGVGLVWANFNVPPSPNGYTSATEGVPYYPACGNETLEYGGTTWHQIFRGDWATPSPQAAGASGGRGISMSAMVVAPPGPGDDVGTLYVYPGGRAYWVSESGAVDAWLTIVPQQYNWVC